MSSLAYALNVFVISLTNFMAVAIMGMADACPDLPFGGLSCQIGNDSSQNVYKFMSYEGNLVVCYL